MSDGVKAVSEPSISSWKHDGVTTLLLGLKFRDTLLFLSRTLLHVDFTTYLL